MADLDPEEAMRLRRTADHAWNCGCSDCRYREGDDPIWEATVRGELDEPPEEYVGG